MMDYLIITVISLGISYFLYHFFLKQEKSFRFNRVYLLGSLTLCLLAPTLEMDFPNSLPSVPTMEIEQATSGFFVQEKIQKAQTVERLERKTNWFFQILFFGYLLITIFFLFRFFRNLHQILNRIKISEVFQIMGLRAVPVKEKNNPYSFFHYLFINGDDLQNRNSSEAIIRHEQAHSKQYHSVDVLFIELLTCFFWCNPFLWLYKKAVAENHEFLADAELAKAGIDLNNYSHQLIQAGNKQKMPPLISGFNFNLTKNRIRMLYKKRSSKAVLALKTGMVLALFSIVFSLTACSRDYGGGSETFVVVVDPGHGGHDPGVPQEKTINLQVAKKLAALSQEGEVEIILTREKDKFVPLADRVEFTKKQNADLFLSLHSNFSEDKNKSGVEAYYLRNGKQKVRSQLYSEILVSNYLEEIAKKGEIAAAGFYVLQKLKIPGVLLELGFLSNSQEAKRLKDPKSQQAIAENIYESLLEIKENR